MGIILVYNNSNIQRILSVNNCICNLQVLRILMRLHSITRGLKKNHYRSIWIELIFAEIKN